MDITMDDCTFEKHSQGEADSRLGQPNCPSVRIPAPPDREESSGGKFTGGQSSRGRLDGGKFTGGGGNFPGGNSPDTTLYIYILFKANGMQIQDTMSKEVILL